MILNAAPGNWALLLGLSFFFGLSFEEHYAGSPQKRPGGIRTFPLLAVVGGLLFLLEPAHALAFIAGLLVLGLLLAAWYRQRLHQPVPDGGLEGSIMVCVCNLLAYLLGPVTLLAPPWLSVGVTVTGVALLGSRETLHHLARRMPAEEIFTLVRFLVLTGIILPLLPRHPVTTLTHLTPYQVWLAVVVISTLSYLSYLAQRFFSSRHGVMLAALLGGLYSSTATTVMLARRSREMTSQLHEMQAAIVLATGLMYLRLLVIIGVFNLALAQALLAPLLGLCLAAIAGAGLIFYTGKDATHADAGSLPHNPLELASAFVFAGLFVIVSLASAWIQARFGHTGLYWLALVVGLTDIDPFVLSVAQNGAAGLGVTVASAALLLAASSNNLLKALYALVFAGWRNSRAAAIALAVLALGGFALAVWRAGLL